MKKRITLTIICFFLLAMAFSAYSKDTHIAQDTLLYVKDHAGEHMLVLKVKECVLESGGEVMCAMEPLEGSRPVQAGPSNSFFSKLVYPEG